MDSTASLLLAALIMPMIALGCSASQQQTETAELPIDFEGKWSEPPSDVAVILIQDVDYLAWAPVRTAKSYHVMQRAAGAANYQVAGSVNASDCGVTRCLYRLERYQSPTQFAVASISNQGISSHPSNGVLLASS